jgi:hypothetical protein
MAPATNIFRAHELLQKHSLQDSKYDFVSTGITGVDENFSGFPRGAMSELVGNRSSGKTSLLVASLSKITRNEEYCAIIDAKDAFDPAGAAQCGVNLRKLIWVQCGGNHEIAVKCADLLLHGGGFGLICLDLSDIAPRYLDRIPMSWWYRFRNAVEGKPTAFVVLTQHALAKSSARCSLQQELRSPVWSGEGPGRLFEGLKLETTRRPPGRAHAVWQAQAAV